MLEISRRRSTNTEVFLWWNGMKSAIEVKEETYPVHSRGVSKMEKEPYEGNVQSEWHGFDYKKVLVR